MSFMCFALQAGSHIESLWDKDGAIELVVLQQINKLHKATVQDTHSVMNGDDMDVVLALVNSVAFHNFHIITTDVLPHNKNKSKVVSFPPVKLA